MKNWERILRCCSLKGSTIDEKIKGHIFPKSITTFKIPRQILILDEIPKGNTGKIQRIGLAKKLGLEHENLYFGGGSIGGLLAVNLERLELMLALLQEGTLRSYEKKWPHSY